MQTLWRHQFKMAAEQMSPTIACLCEGREGKVKIERKFSQAKHYQQYQRAILGNFRISFHRHFKAISGSLFVARAVVFSTRSWWCPRTSQKTGLKFASMLSRTPRRASQHHAQQKRSAYLTLLSTAPRVKMVTAKPKRMTKSMRITSGIWSGWRTRILFLRMVAVPWWSSQRYFRGVFRH